MLLNEGINTAPADFPGSGSKVGVVMITGRLDKLFSWSKTHNRVTE